MTYPWMRADYEVGKIADPAIQAEVAEAAVAGKLTRSEVAEVVQAVRALKLAQEQRRDDEAA